MSETPDVLVVGAGLGGLSSLAGDYTRQKFTATMEGAVVSGRLAADAARASLDGS